MQNSIDSRDNLSTELGAVQFYCDSLYVCQIVIPTILFSKICKPEEGWYGQPKYFSEKAIPVVMIIFAVVLGLLIYLEVGVF